MEYFGKACALALIAMILYQILAKKEKDIASVLTVAACCIITVGALSYLEPVMELLQNLQQLGNFDMQFVGILLKATGIGLLAEISALLCSDLGNAALGKTLQIASTAVILWLALPLFTELLSMLTGIMEGI